MRTHRKTQLYREERIWFFGASLLLLALFLAYMYFVSASVHHVVVRKELSQQIAETSTYVGELESQYIEAQHTMSEEIASRQGFVEVQDKVFIERRETNLVLSDNIGG